MPVIFQPAPVRVVVILQESKLDPLALRLRGAALSVGDANHITGRSLASDPPGAAGCARASQRFGASGHARWKMGPMFRRAHLPRPGAETRTAQVAFVRLKMPWEIRHLPLSRSFQVSLMP